MMVSLELARRLKQAGLNWNPGMNDFFAIPDRGLDDKIFVLSEILSLLGSLHGDPVVTFHGTAEWALDYLLTGEVIWLPTEDQLRHKIWEILQGSSISHSHGIRIGKSADRRLEKDLHLVSTPDYHQCTLRYKDMELSFDAATAADAYGKALLHLLEAVQG